VKVKLAILPGQREAVENWLAEAQVSGLVRRWQQNGSPETLDVELVPQTASAESQCLLPMSEARFKPPKLKEVHEYAASVNAPPNVAEDFWNYYAANGWRVGRNPMRDWRAAFRLWASRTRAWEARRSTAPPDALARLKLETDRALALLDAIRVEPDAAKRAELIAQRKAVLEEIDRLRREAGLYRGRTASPSHRTNSPCTPQTPTP
jgi:hypothetical protein